MLDDALIVSVAKAHIEFIIVRASGNTQVAC